MTRGGFIVASWKLGNNIPAPPEVEEELETEPPEAAAAAAAQPLGPHAVEVEVEAGAAW